MQRCQCYNILFCPDLRDPTFQYVSLSESVLCIQNSPTWSQPMSFRNEPALSILSPRIDLGMGLPDLFIVLILIFHTVVMHSMFYYCHDLTPFSSFHGLLPNIMDPIPMCLSVFRTFRIIPIICNTTSHVLSPVMDFIGYSILHLLRLTYHAVYSYSSSELWMGCYAIGY